MAYWERDVRSLLRPSEHLLLVLEGSSPPHGWAESESSKAPPPTSSDKASLGSSSEESRVILAVVGHIMNHAMEESGSVFLYTEENAVSKAVHWHGHGSHLVLRHTFAIHGEFSLAISQLARPSSALVLDASPEIEPLSPSDARICVQLSDDESTYYSIFTDDIERLSSVASACRRLRDSALKNSEDAGSYKWLEPYALYPSSWLSVNPPRDLRHACRPVHSRLSLGCAGQPLHDAVDYVAIRDDWLWSRSLSLATVREASEKKQQLRIRVGIFNVNGKLPTQDLSPWLGVALPSKSGRDVPKEQASTPDADILVTGFQEADLSTEAFFNLTGAAREDSWTTAILAALGDKAEQYEKLTSKQLVGILLIIFVKKDLRNSFTGVIESSVASGFMGVMGNKGGVAVRLGYRPNPTLSAPSPVPITFTVVNSHLAAFDDHLERRNTDFHDISRRIEFGPCAEYLWTPRTKHSDAGPRVLNIYASDVLFWLGDLNYRLTLPDPDVRSLLYSGPKPQEIKTLLQYDELKSSIRHSKAFVEFEEYPIGFFPTYRFAVGVQTDAAGYDIKRKPAWTDRILHLSSPFVSVNQTSYEAHPPIAMSDHKPVSAEFLVDIPCIDSAALDLAAHDLYKSSATFDPDNPSGIPLLKLDKLTLDFGKVSYSTPVTQSLNIRNAGKVPAAFRFFPRDLSSPVHPRWLKIEPMAGFLLPGEETTLQLTIFVSHTIAAPLNMRMETLSTLLIVHTLFGQDIFVSLVGKYDPSCFGTPLSALTRLTGPIRELKSPHDLLPETQVNHSSRELMRLMGWLTAHDVEAIHDLFIAPGDERLAMQMRESLDTGTDFPPCPAPTAPQTMDANYARTMAAVLLAFLCSLPEPVVPFSLHERCAEITSREAALEMLAAFPPASVNVWITVTAFLHLLALRDNNHQAEAQDERPLQRPLTHENAKPSPVSRAEILASIFAPVLLRDDIDAASPVSLLGKKRFLLFFMGGS